MLARSPSNHASISIRCLEIAPFGAGTSCTLKLASNVSDWWVFYWKVWSSHGLWRRKQDPKRHSEQAKIVTRFLHSATQAPCISTQFSLSESYTRPATWGPFSRMKIQIVGTFLTRRDSLTNYPDFLTSDLIALHDRPTYFSSTKYVGWSCRAIISEL